MTVSIIIPTCKTAEEISPMLCNIEGFSRGCEVIATCLPGKSAAQNRNAGLNKATGDIIIMVDDDVSGFYPTWWQGMVWPVESAGATIVSARLLNPDGSPGVMMYGGDPNVPLTEVPRCNTAAIAFRRSYLRFNEDFIGSGYEDDDFMARVSEKWPYGRIVINNKVKLVHKNEMKNQRGDWEVANRATFHRLWKTSGDGTVRTRAPRTDIKRLDKMDHGPTRLSELRSLMRMPLDGVNPDGPQNRVDGLIQLIEEYYPANAVVAELGTGQGVSTEVFAILCGAVYSFDLNPNWDWSNDDIGVVSRWSNVHLINKDAAYAASDYNDGHFDALYVDELHDYDSVISDLTAWVPKVRRGGVISGHDYLECQQLNFGVIRAVRDFFAHEPEKVFGDTSWVVKV